jgi:hypothetical protein
MGVPPMFAARSGSYFAPEWFNSWSPSARRSARWPMRSSRSRTNEGNRLLGCGAGCAFTEVFNRECTRIDANVRRIEGRARPLDAPFRSCECEECPRRAQRARPTVQPSRRPRRIELVARTSARAGRLYTAPLTITHSFRAAGTRSRCASVVLLRALGVGAASLCPLCFQKSVWRSALHLVPSRQLLRVKSMTLMPSLGSSSVTISKADVVR